MKASTCLERELASRGLALPARLVAELRAACRAPFTGQLTLWDRLQRGCAVLDAAGDDDALWDRWEAILAAWVCTQQEVGMFAPKPRPRAPRKGGQRETTRGPSFKWQTEKGTRS